MFKQGFSTERKVFKQDFSRERAALKAWPHTNSDQARAFKLFYMQL